MALFARWGGPVATEADLLLHHVVEGSAWLSSRHGETLALTAGDVSKRSRHEPLSVRRCLHAFGR